MIRKTDVTAACVLANARGRSLMLSLQRAGRRRRFIPGTMESVPADADFKRDELLYARRYAEAYAATATRAMDLVVAYVDQEIEKLDGKGSK